MLTCKPFTLNSCFSQTKCDQMWRNVCKPPQILSDWSLLHLCTLPRHRMLQMLQMWDGCNPSVGQDHRNSGFPTKSGVRCIQRNFLATNLIGNDIGPNEKVWNTSLLVLTFLSSPLSLLLILSLSLSGWGEQGREVAVAAIHQPRNYTAQLRVHTHRPSPTTSSSSSPFTSTSTSSSERKASTRFIYSHLFEKTLTNCETVLPPGFPDKPKNCVYGLVCL